MKKMLSFILSLFCLIALCTITTAYIVNLKLATETEPSKPRYKLIFGTIIKTNSEPVPGNPEVSVLTPIEQPVCFKFDTITGETWRYVSDFYQDVHGTRLTKGFESVEEDPFIYQFTEKRKPIEELDFSDLIPSTPTDITE